MLGDYFIFLPLGAGTLFLSVLGYVSIEQAVLERRRQQPRVRQAPRSPFSPARTLHSRRLVAAPMAHA
jgi:hypothetical protein